MQIYHLGNGKLSATLKLKSAAAKLHSVHTTFSKDEQINFNVHTL